MGTPGKVILKANGKTVHIYNHSDSYPSHLGVKLIGYLLTLLKTYTDTPSEALPKIKQRIEQCKWIPDNSYEHNESDTENLYNLLSLYYPKDELDDDDGCCHMEMLHESEKFYDANIVEMMKTGYFVVTSEENFENMPGYRLCVYCYIYTLDFDLEEFAVVAVSSEIRAVYPFSMLTENNASVLMDGVKCTRSINLNEL